MTQCKGVICHPFKTAKIIVFDPMKCNMGASWEYGSLAVTHSRCCFTPIVAESVGVVTSPHVTKMAVTPYDRRF